MILVNELRGKIVAKGFTQEEIASRIGMCSATFARKMKKGVFDSDEIVKLVDCLEISDPWNIFFAKQVT